MKPQLTRRGLLGFLAGAVGFVFGKPKPCDTVPNGRDATATSAGTKAIRLECWGDLPAGGEATYFGPLGTRYLTVQVFMGAVKIARSRRGSLDLSLRLQTGESFALDGDGVTVRSEDEGARIGLLWQIEAPEGGVPVSPARI